MFLCVVESMHLRDFGVICMYATRLGWPRNALVAYFRFVSPIPVSV